MEKLKSELLGIVRDKHEQLRFFDQESVEYTVLEEEINDASYMLMFLNSYISDKDKTTAIRVINDNTTSAKIFDAVSYHIGLNDNVRSYKSLWTIGLTTLVGVAGYRLYKNRKKRSEINIEIGEI